MKYTIHSTKKDWENLYSQVAKFPDLDVKFFKKSSSFDMCVTAFYSFLRQEKGMTTKDAILAYPIFAFDQTIRTTTN